MGNTYVKKPITDEGVSQSGEAQNDDMDVICSQTLPVVGFFRDAVPSGTIYVKIRRKHFGESEAPLAWVGYILQVSRPDSASAKITCHTLDASFNRSGRRLTWQRACPYMLFGPGCNLDKAPYATTATVTVRDGPTVTLDAYAHPDGWANGGFFEWTTDEGFIERRPIESQVGNHFVVFTTASGVTVGTVLTIYPGCARIIQVCHDKFGNEDNFGGIPQMPGKSPFDGDPIF